MAKAKRFLELWNYGHQMLPTLPYKKTKLELKEAMPLPELVRRVITAYGLQPCDINNGNCDYFAEDFLFAAKLLGNPGKFFVTPDDEDLPGHCWAFVNGKHFDAEAPEGVSDWRELPIFKTRSESSP